MRWRIGVIAAVMAGAGLGGCGPVGFKGDATSSVEGPAAPPGTWPFAPVAMRVHPFSSISVDAQQKALVLEARVELLDQLGDTTKGVGEFRFELYADQPQASQRGLDQRLNVWDAPISSLELNRQHYDSITRTYAFKLRLDPAPPADQKLRLVAQFTDQAGRRILAEGPLSYNAAKP